MVFLRRIAATVARIGQRIIKELHWALPQGNAGSPTPWAELDELEEMRRRKREVWRRGVDED